MKLAKLAGAAQKAKDHVKVANLETEWSYERDSIIDPTNAAASERLIARAKRYGIKVPPYPHSHSDDSDEWERSRTTSDWILSNEAERNLRLAIREEQRGRYDEFRKWGTFTLALAGFLLGFLALYVKQKQPDPCARNYYRNDAGACVFALSSETPKHSEANPSTEKLGKKAKAIESQSVDRNGGREPRKSR